MSEGREEGKKEKPEENSPTRIPPSTGSPNPIAARKVHNAPKNRDFFKLLAGAGVMFTLIPLIPTGLFLTGLTGLALEFPKQKIGNTNEFKPNSSKNFIYPKTGIPVKDGDPFRQFLLLRLPEDLAKKDERVFKAYSRVCVHLWCLWQYDDKNSICACPCHGSIYDPVTGVAICGPAAFQSPPNNTLPEIELEIDQESGDIFALSVVGDIGYGRSTDKKPVVKFPC